MIRCFPGLTSLFSASCALLALLLQTWAWESSFPCNSRSFISALGQSSALGCIWCCRLLKSSRAGTSTKLSAHLFQVLSCWGMFLWAPWCRWQGVMLCKSHFVAGRCLSPPGALVVLLPQVWVYRNQYLLLDYPADLEKPAKALFRLKAGLFFPSCVRAGFSSGVCASGTDKSSVLPRGIPRGMCLLWQQALSCWSPIPTPCVWKLLGRWSQPGGGFPSIPRCSQRWGALFSWLSPLEVPFPCGSLGRGCPQPLPIHVWQTEAASCETPPR